jgi:hypothetical protein
MRPVRTITELLFAPAIAISGWSEHHGSGQPGGPATPPAPGRDLQWLGRLLGLGLTGLIVLVTGLLWDARLHADNPELAHEEGLFTLSNPGHLLLFVGIVTAAAGMVGATWTRLGLTADPRRSRRARCLLLLSMAYMTGLSAVALNRTASAESAAHAHGPAAHAVAHHPTGSCEPTSGQLNAASTLVADTSRSLAGFADLRDAKTAGYAPHHRVPEAIKHYFNSAYVTDGRVIDPARPEGLMYASTNRGPVLVAAVYLMNRAGEPGRPVGGCLTQWHTHDNLCSSDPANGKITGLRTPGRRCPPGQVPWAAPVMLHTWIIDVPGGPFAHQVDVTAIFRELHAAPRSSSG